MSKSTTKGANTTSTSKSESTSKSPSTSTDSTSAKAESTSAKTDSAPAEKSTKGVAAADHSPSYFSSVSTPKYRAGWDSVFTSGKAKKA